MDISEFVGVLRNPKAMASYGSFYSQMFPNGQFVFSKKEKAKIRSFYESVHALPPTKRLNFKALGELQTLIDSLDFVEAKKKEQKSKRKHTRKPKRKKRTPLQKPTLKEVIESRKNLPTIGLGLEPVTVIPKVKSEEVVVDSHTTQTDLHEKHILYAAGWSMKETESDESVS
ncbi:hypothetical protein [Vibrio pelagius]|uniref:hypothetical protein n=1 Tax=Vibrio pelagius TaxID=28169 RepID=UPI0021C3271B|nr:hypothetical protein [Vibrio pelagius]